MYRSALLALLVVVIVAGFAGRPLRAAAPLPVWFVDANAAAGGDGTSWAEAFKTLETALAKAGDKEVWVADGTYKPPIPGAHQPDKRTATFTMNIGDRVYGGFAGGETSRSQRDVSANVAILSGEIQTTAITDNAYTVVTIQGPSNSTTILDGFTVRDAHETRAFQRSGGIESQGGSPVLANLLVKKNLGTAGSGFSSSGGNPTISDSRFEAAGNTAVEVVEILVAGGVLTMTDTTVTIDGGPELLARVDGGVLEGHGLSLEGGTGTSTDALTIQPLGEARLFGSRIADLQLGVRNLGQLRIEDTTFSGVVTALIQQGTGMDVERSLFSGSDTAVSSIGGATFANTTFDGNGRALHTSGDELLNNVTFSENGAPAEPSLSVDPGGEVTIRNTIFWDVFGVETEGDGTIDFANSVVRGGCPAVSGVSCSGAVVTADPLLGALADHGGETATRLLGTNSPAIDAGHNATCADDDQRGDARPQDGDGDTVAECDMGAVEMPAVDPPSVQFGSSTSTALEDAGTVFIGVQMPSHVGGAAVDYAVTGGTATGAGVDFTLAAGTLIFEANDTLEQLSLAIVDDAVDELAETVIITLSDPSGAVLGARKVHTVTIGGDTPSVRMQKPSSSSTEKNGTVAIDVALTIPADGTVSAKYAVTGTASQGSDFVLANGTVEFAAGQVKKTLSVQLKDDLFVEGTETVVVTLTSAIGANLHAAKSHTLTVTDNERRAKCGGLNATIVGTAGVDVIAGTPGADVIASAGGNDRVNARSGDDVICSGGGNDTVNGGGGSDTMLAGAGNDAVSGGAGKDAVKAGGGTDKVTGGGGNDDLRGGGGADSVAGQGGRDKLAGGPGAGDRCDGGPAVDVLFAGHGCEVVVAVP